MAHNRHLKLRLTLLRLPSLEEGWKPRTTWEKFHDGQDYIFCKVSEGEKVYYIVARWLTPWPDYQVLDPGSRQTRKLAFTVSFSLPEVLKPRTDEANIIPGVRDPLSRAIKELHARIAPI